MNEIRADHGIERNEDGYNVIGRRRVQANVPRSGKGRGVDITRTLTKPDFVEVNDDGQPIGDSQRKLSTLIGCLARDPMRLPLDCFDWRNMDDDKKKLLWLEVKRSYTFPEGKEPYDWVMGKFHSCWRSYKSDLKVEYFDGKTLANAIGKRPEDIPPEMWENLVKFWASDKGKERSKVGIENRSKLKICHYASTKSFACVRAEDEADGKKMDKLQTWFKTHAPKEGSKLDDASSKAKQSIGEGLARLHDVQDNTAARDEIFEKVAGEDKYEYAKTFGFGGLDFLALVPKGVHYKKRGQKE